MVVGFHAEQVYILEVILAVEAEKVLFFSPELYVINFECLLPVAADC